MIQLSEEQQGAVNASAEGDLICIAAPGSGKTETLIQAIVARLKETPSMREEMVIAITFTRLATQTMRDRLEERLGRPHRVRITTFHSLCFDLVSSNWKAIGLRHPDLLLLDAGDAKDLLKRTISDHPRTVTQRRVEQHMDALWRGDLPSKTAGKVDQDAANVMLAYFDALKDLNAVCYRTVMIWARPYFKAVPCRFLFVDEAQDIDAGQWECLSMIDGARRFIVGDRDQCIYEWRGARPDLMEVYGRGKRWPLTINRRSGATIVGMANCLIAHNEDPKRHPMKALDGASSSCELHPESETVEWLLQHHTEEIGNSSIGVLGRTHEQLRTLSYQLQAAGVEHELVGRKDRLAERPEVKLLASYLAWRHLPKATRLAERVLRREGWSDIQIAAATYDAARKGSTVYQVIRDRPDGISEFLRELEEASSFTIAAGQVIDRFATLGCELLQDEMMDLRRMMATFVRSHERAERTGARFLYWLVTRDSQDDLLLSGLDNEGVHRVRLMTIHASKGLEFDTVVLIGLHDRSLPDYRNHNDPMKLAAERRLFFVAITRAKRRLVFSLPHEPGMVSRFVKECG